MSKKKEMKWEVKKIKEGPSKGMWGTYLMQEFCKTDEPVCYGACHSKESAEATVERMNDPKYWNEVED